MNKNFMECEAIKNLLADYADAVYHADIDRLKTIFHEKAFMNGFLGEDLLIGDVSPFYADLGSKPSMADNKDDFRYVIKHLEVVGNLAQATLFVDGFYGAATIQDCFHLVKCDGKWRIICKSFTTL